MSNIQITNNTKLPIHVATSWANIVQEFINDVEPGDTVNLPAAGFGWQDLSIVTGTPENKINHNNDWSAVLGLGGAVLGGLGTIAGVCLLPFSGGASTGIIAAGAAATGASVISLSAGTAVMIGEFQVHPVHITALWGPDGYTVNVDGGDIIGELNENKEFVINDVKPIKAHWTNKTSGTKGTVTSHKK
ncbi:hypothetical protein BOW53_11525 [Solemya pervernicosa gill symbiont]|uniref:Uncharacterized protein n=1 Tax=Solemya pervernicosa gill symbiont TaxID=642797 RepID=A0A1T2L3C4_9GAMM|nr:hypothetical protein [Solemya pervernicosa gill symbiont]OOZ39436.1 hypothetical protein BOW53_11525 [Solemya pervernicosa gill symbiont]